MILLLLSISLSLSGWAATVPPCDARLTSPGRTYLRLLQKALEDGQVGEAQLRELSAGHLINPLQGQTASANIILLQAAFAQTLQSLSTAPEIEAQVRGLAADILRKSAVRAIARQGTRSVLVPRERDTAFHTERFEDSPTRFFWFRDRNQRTFVAIQQGAGLALHVVQVQPENAAVLLRKPEEISGGRYVLKSNYFLQNEQLKIIYFKDRSAELILYDVASEQKSSVKVEGRGPRHLMVVDSGYAQFLISVKPGGVDVYAIESAGLRQVRQIHEEFEGLDAVTNPHGALILSGWRGRTGYVFDPLRSENPLREWTFAHTIKDLKAEVNADGEILAAIHVADEGLRLGYQSRKLVDEIDSAGVTGFSWHRSIGGELMMAMSTPGHVRVARADLPASRFVDYPMPQKGANARWLPSSDGHDYLGIFNPLDLERQSISILDVKPDGSGQVITRGTAIRDSGEFVYLPQMARWLYYFNYGQNFHLTDVQAQNEVRFVSFQNKISSPPFEVTPGEWVTAVIGDGHLKIINLTQPLSN